MDLAGANAIGFDRSACDISDAAAVEHVFNTTSPTLVVNCAAYTAVDLAESEREKAFQVNSIAAGIVARASASRALPVIHLSTDYVYAGTGLAPLHESEPIFPINCYGASKAAGDAAVREGNPAHLLLRVSWVFGKYGNNFVKTMLRLGQEREELRVVNDQRGAPTEARDIANTVLLLAQACRSSEFRSWGTYHYSSQPVTTWYEFAAEIFRQAHLRSKPRLLPISSGEYKTAAARPLNSMLDCSKIRRVFSIAQPDWRLSLQRVLAELSEQ
jgi:dTDP-4-dehydrorhamnose reductase